MADLDPSSPVPIYRQLSAHFVREIETGKLREGERLPANRELAGQLGLNRTTVSAAYDLLESEGWIAGEVGRGSFVRSRVPAHLNWSRLLTPSLTPRNPPLFPVPISFAHSRPSEDLFPIEAFRQSTEAVLNGPSLSSILQLGAPAGYEPLRRYLLEQARAEGNATDNDDLLVTNGCQQALDLLRQVLITPGDTVALEDPVYPVSAIYFSNLPLLSKASKSRRTESMSNRSRAFARNSPSLPRVSRIRQVPRCLKQAGSTGQTSRNHPRRKRYLQRTSLRRRRATHFEAP